MSCCPDEPEISVGGSADDGAISPSMEMQPGESLECYMRRSGNATGWLDDKTNPVPNKITTTDIPLVRGYIVNNVKFAVAPSEPAPEPQATVTSWTIVSDPPLPAGVTFTSNGATATLNGEFPAATHGKRFKLTVTAVGTLDGVAGPVDSRAFNFSPAKATGSNSISFVHPLSGAHVTSRFGHRKAPKPGASTQHGGVDFSVTPRPPADVLAAAGGEVIFRDPIRGGGNTIVIQHFDANNKPLCTTHYMHLASFYVAKGQIVVAGQKIAKEGSTGVSTGPHLHFECRLPNGDKIDPLPLIRGTVAVATAVDENNEAVGALQSQSGNASLTADNVTAKESSCEPFGPTYPGAKNDPAINPAEAPAGGPFEKAWFFTMKHEVGPHWTTALETDPDVRDGKIDTDAQRKKCGLVTKKGFPGGITKFGIAQNANTDLKVMLINYETAKKRGFSSYWKTKDGPHTLVATKPKTAVMLFDIVFLHGPGNGRKMARDAGITNTNISDDEAVALLSKRQRQFINDLPNSDDYGGWYTRNSDLLAYVKGLTFS